MQIGNAKIGLDQTKVATPPWVEVTIYVAIGFITFLGISFQTLPPEFMNQALSSWLSSTCLALNTFLVYLMKFTGTVPPAEMLKPEDQ